MQRGRRVEGSINLLMGLTFYKRRVNYESVQLNDWKRTALRTRLTRPDPKDAGEQLR